MEKKTSIVIRIGGKEHTIVTASPLEYANKINGYVRERFEKLQKTNTSVADELIWLLTALNLTDELFRAQDETAALREQLAAGKQREQQLLTEIETLRIASTQTLVETKPGIPPLPERKRSKL